MSNSNARIKVLGVGGAGCNAVNYMIEETIRGVEFYGLNTDLQALESSDIEQKIQIGKELTNGLGAGSDPEIGKKSAEEDEEAIKHILEGSDMVFITAGMGGGTGTGAAPVVARIAKEMNILTIGVVTKPFSFENRNKSADKGIEELKKHIDSLLIIPNDKLSLVLDSSITAMEAFSKSNEVLQKSIKGIAELITNPGFINVDFADVKKVMSDSGVSMMGLGVASGENRVKEATEQAMNASLLELTSIKGSKGIVINVSGNFDLPLCEFQEVGNIVKEYAHKDANIITGMSLNHELSDQICVTVVATHLTEINDDEEGIEDDYLSFSHLKNKGDNLKNKILQDESDLNKENACDDKNSIHNQNMDIPSDKNMDIPSDENMDITNEDKNDTWDMPSFLQRNDN